MCPWWDGPLVKSRLESQLRDAAAERLQRWIWVHHAPPANSPTSWGGKRFFGDVELVQWIGNYQPSMVISGHVHQSPFIADGSWFDRLGTTWVFNTGLQPGRPPTHIVLDIDDGTAFWLAGATVLALANPAMAGDTIKIGFVSTFSGPTAVIGNDMRNSFELALDHIGRKMGGKPVEVIYEDDGQKPDVGKQKTEKLIQSDKVDFIAGYIWSNVLLASLKPRYAAADQSQH